VLESVNDWVTLLLFQKIYLVALIKKKIYLVACSNVCHGCLFYLIKMCVFKKALCTLCASLTFRL
jgi:hypothetical protein